MSVRLSELLKLDVLSTFNVVAGEGGLDRKVRKVGILDHELGEIIDDNFIEGELVLTNLLFIKDDLAQLEDIIHRLIRAGTGGLAIKPLYIDEIPEHILKIADENQYPIFLYETVYYEDIITELVNYIKKSDELNDQLIYINELKNEDLDPVEAQKLAYRLNPDFRNWIVALDIVLSGKQENMTFRPYHGNQVLGRHHKCYMDGNRVYMLLSFEEEIKDETIINDLVRSTGISESAIAGGRGTVKNISHIHDSLIEASYAQMYAELYNKNGITAFEQMGMFQMLLPLSRNPWMSAYYKRIITPLVEYDLKNGSDLVNTAQIYIESGCDVKKTAEALYQHGNTIRYRLDRIKSLLESVVDKNFIDQELSIAIRLHMLLGDR